MTSPESNRIPSPCNCLNLRRAAQALTGLYDAILDPCGLSIAQFSLLKHIQSLEPVNVSRLGEAMRLDRTTLVRNLKPLEERGLILDLAPRTARDRQLSLSASGRASYQEALGLWERAQEKVSAALGPESLDQLTRLLRKVEQLRP
jgi:DNA-binding MarR family transcriptional regulator